MRLMIALPATAAPVICWQPLENQRSPRFTRLMSPFYGAGGAAFSALLVTAGQLLGQLWFASSTVPGNEVLTASDDSELIAAALRGKRLAFHALYMRYSPQILGFLRRQMGNPHTAEDLLQEVFIRAFRSLDRFEARSSFRTWLFVIARNRLHSHYAKTRPLPEASDPDSVLSSMPDGSASPLDVLQQQEQLASVERTLAPMRPPQREIFLLRHTHQLSYEELSEVLGVPIGTVKSRLTRAIAEFWRLYKGGSP